MSDLSLTHPAPRPPKAGRFRAPTDEAPAARRAPMSHQTDMMPNAARKNSPLASWCHWRWANLSSLSQRGRSSGWGRRPRIEVPSVASMFSPSMRRYVVR